MPAAKACISSCDNLFRLLDTDTNARAALGGGDWIAFLHLKIPLKFNEREETDGRAERSSVTSIL